jgi:hypothetical protein
MIVRLSLGCEDDAMSLRAAALLAVCLIMLSPAAWAAKSTPRGHGGCCRVAAGTPVTIELVDQVSSNAQKAGDRFALRLAAPLVVDGRVVLRAGTPGVGEVIESTGPRIGGKPAKLVLAASYLKAGRRQVPLNGLQLAGPGRSRAKISQGLGVAGLAVAPLGIVGIVLPGGDVAFPPGTEATAKVAAAVTLPPLGRASARDIAAGAPRAGAEASESEGPIAIPPPPPGEGQVVFFRPKSRLSLGEWFKVREDGQELGKLANGAYFVHVTPPGVHTYTAKLEPELKDHLRLKIDAGETYFVEGAVTGGLAIGAADLSPSTRERFNKAAKDLKMAEEAGAEPRPATPPQ